MLTLHKSVLFFYETAMILFCFYIVKVQVCPLLYTEMNIHTQ